MKEPIVYSMKISLLFAQDQYKLIPINPLAHQVWFICGLLYQLIGAVHCPWISQNGWKTGQQFGQKLTKKANTGSANMHTTRLSQPPPGRFHQGGSAVNLTPICRISAICK